MNFDLEGTATDLVNTIAADGTIAFKDSVEIMAENGCELYGRTGRYYAINFTQRLCKEKNITMKISVKA